MSTDVLIAVAERKQVKDLAITLIGKLSLMLFDDLRFKTSSVVSRRFQLKVTRRTLHDFTGGAVFAVGLTVTGEEFIQFYLHSRFTELLDESYARC